MRPRALGLAHRAAPMPPRQKALPQRKVELPPVVSASPGHTGRQSLRALGAGERAPQALAQVRHGRGPASEAESATAWTGHYRPAPVFALTQALALQACYPQHGQACAAPSAQPYAALHPTSDAPTPPPPLGAEPQPQAPAKNAPACAVRACL